MPVTTSRTRASPAQSWSARSPTTLVRTLAAGSSLVGLPEHADGEAAGVRHAAVVDRLQPGQHPQQGRLAAAVAPDDADPVAGRDAQRHAVEQHPGAERRLRPLEVHQVVGHARPFVLTGSSAGRRCGRRAPGRARA
ncbi:hypothetical protein GCM10025868_15140 [Angustibacter aerolatus]|uniref:Uncharacterized protein n=1 Tax=Angustibacter aerolatus TaxID=1162965 RepID=A0ABQ6JEM8_9ACTN|nr:hypothetical protein GCM10025868_15140 [Angustibacter aerolatus]